MNKSLSAPSGTLKRIFTFAAGLTFIIFVLTLLSPSSSNAEGPLIPQGTAQEDVFIWAPENSIDLPVVTTADYQPEEELPTGVSYPPGIIGQAFSFGLWKGENVTIKQFDPSIVVNVKYKQSDVPSVSGTEEKLQLLMYDPSVGTWIKTCSSVDIYVNTVSAALSSTTPFENGNSNLQGSTLLAIAVNDSSPLKQVVDSQGATTISMSGADFSLQVPPGTVELGSYFEATMLPNLAGSSPLLRLLSRPVALKACQMDYLNPTQGSRELTRFAEPLKVGFDYDLDTSARAGGQANLTLAELRSNRWLDLEELGFRVVRRSGNIVVDTTHLGTFSLAAR